MTANFADEANWLGLYDNLVMAVLGNPIPPITLPNSLNYRFLRIAANNQNAMATWSLGGYAYLMVDENLPQVQIGNRIFCDVNKPIIVPVPDWLTSYRLKISPPKWFDELSLQVDGYLESIRQTLFAPSATPVLDAQSDEGASYELAQQFQVSRSGFVDAIRFYKATGESGTHVGRIWSSSGSLLASVTFSGESATGWQEQALVSPLAISANTSYLVSVNSNGLYVSTNYNPAITLSRGDISGSSSGVFGSIGVFPTSSFNNNYFRDIVFR